MASRAVRSGASRRCWRRSPTPSTTRRATGSQTPTSWSATRAPRCAHSSSARGRPTSSSSIPARRALEEGRAARDRVREAHQFMRRATRRRWRPTPPSSSRLDIGCGGAPRGHVPPDPAHRVRGPSGEALSTRGFGVAAGLDPSVAEPLAVRRAMLGYSSMRSNDTPVGSGLETIALFAAAVPGIDFGVAVLALDRHTPEQIAEKILDLGLPPERLWIGVGAGFERPLTRMRDAQPRAARGAAGHPAGPRGDGACKMCALAGADYDGAFLNRVTPEYAAARASRCTPAPPRPIGGHPRLWLRAHRGRGRREGAARQGGGLLPRPPRRLPQPLRPARRARGHGWGRGGE